MGRGERIAWRVLGLVVKGVVLCYLLLGLVLYGGSIAIYLSDNLDWPTLPFWQTAWVLVKAQFIGFLVVLPNWFGKVMAGFAAMWLYVKILRFILPHICSLRRS